MRLIGCTLDPLINRRARINHANPQSSCWRGCALCSWCWWCSGRMQGGELDVGTPWSSMHGGL